MVAGWARRGWLAAAAVGTLAAGLGARKGAAQPIGRLVETGPRDLPEFAFTDAEGRSRTVADFAGRGLVINLWATWCPPCLKEMPALDALQTALGGPDFAVVAINIDTRNLDKPKAWLAQREIKALTYYADPQARVFQELRAARKVDGMPVSLIVDRDGCELAILPGPADWASADAKALIGAALKRP